MCEREIDREKERERESERAREILREREREIGRDSTLIPERETERDWTLMPDVFMCIHMLVIAEGREGETETERGVNYKYRENIKTKRDI